MWQYIYMNTMSVGTRDTGLTYPTWRLNLNLYICTWVRLQGGGVCVCVWGCFWFTVQSTKQKPITNSPKDLRSSKKPASQFPVLKYTLLRLHLGFLPFGIKSERGQRCPILSGFRSNQPTNQEPQLIPPV